VVVSEIEARTAAIRAAKDAKDWRLQAVLTSRELDQALKG
jgi:hypothetical protein